MRQQHTRKRANDTSSSSSSSNSDDDNEQNDIVDNDFDMEQSFHDDIKEEAENEEHSSAHGNEEETNSSNDNDDDNNDNDNDNDDDDFITTEEQGFVMNDNNEENQKVIETTTPLVLSKSWAVQSAHVPNYTGGKIQAIVVSDNNNGEQFITDDTNDKLHHHNNNNNSPQSSSSSSNSSLFLFTSVNGDVSIVNAKTGTSIGTIRRGIHSAITSNEMILSDNNNDDDDDDDDQDFDAITAFAVSSNHRMIVTCSRNMILRLYSIQYMHDHRSHQDTTNQLQSNTETLRNEYDGDDNDDDDGGDNNNKNNNNNNIIDNNDDEMIDGGNTNQNIISKIILTKTWGKSGHTLPVNIIEFHTSCIFLATGSVDGTVRIWDVRGGFVTHVYRPMGNNSIYGEEGTAGLKSITSLCWFPDVQQLIISIGRADGSICIHNLRSSSVNNNTDNVIVLTDHVSAVTCMEWNVQHQLFVTAGRDQVINLWIFQTVVNGPATITKKSSKKKTKNHVIVDSVGVVQHSYKKVKTLPIYEQIEGTVILSSNESGDDSLLIATCGTKGQIRLWKVSSSNSDLVLFMEQSLTDAFGEQRGGYCYLQAIHSTSTTNSLFSLVVADAENNISFLSLQKERKELITTGTIVGHNDEILDLKVIPTKLPNKPQQKHAKSSENLARKIVVVTNSSQVRIFDLQTFSCCYVLDKHTATCLCVDVSPCGNYIATCGKDKTARIWCMLESRKQHQQQQPKCVAIAIGHTESVGSVALSRKASRYYTTGKAARNGGGSFIVTVSMDRTIKRWNLPGSDVLVKHANNDIQEEPAVDGEIHLIAFASARAHEKDVNIVTIAPNDSLIATGSQDKTIRLWKSTDLSLIATLKGHKRGVWDCQFSSTDRVLASASGDKTIKLWSIASGDYSCVRTFQGHVSSVLRVRFATAGLQLLSSGADGLLKLWTIRTNEAEATMDVHNDKVWAMDISLDGKTLVSGGADSNIVVWKDTTKEVEEAKQAEEEEAILLDQKLANHLRHKEYGAALDISLDRDKPHLTLKVLNSIIENSCDPEKNKSQPMTPGIKHRALFEVKKYAKVWMSSTERLIRLLQYCREWNTKARNCHVAMITLKAVVTTVTADKLATTEGIPEILAGIAPYAERHLDRLDRLHESSYLFDFALSAMGDITTASAANFSEPDDSLRAWEARSKLVLPLKHLDGRVDIGGNVIVGAAAATRNKNNVVASDSESDEVLIVGESDDSDEE